ncbi:MAG: xanthine dehydrogenase family protein subunit M [Streptosporangiales bacterium]|nr:xanthine dehydrogenase family protein subunit M [Streptosporangiales bacterium]
MKPPPFAYFDPTTLEEALGLKAQHGLDASVLAGGQSLVPLLNMRLASPEVLVDTNRVDGLGGLRRSNGTLELGSMVRQYVLEDDEVVAQAVPLLAAAARHVGHRENRHRGTVGGSLAHADPAAELPCLALVLSAELVARSNRGERVIPASDFFDGFMSTVLQPDEILTAVRIPVPAGNVGWGFEEVARRFGDFALAAAAALVTLGDDGSVASASVALAGVSDTPVRATEYEQALVGTDPTPDNVASAARIIERLVTTSDDIHATQVYRRKVAAVTASRAVTAAVNRARGGE